MAKLRNDTRNKNNNNSNNNGQIRSSNNSKKPDRWQPLRGWVTTVEKDDTDIESWVKRRRQAELRAAKSSSRSAVNSEWLPASTSLTGLCQSIEDVSAFRQQSLCEALDPLHLQKKDVSLHGKRVTANPDAENGTAEVVFDEQDGDRNGDKVLDDGVGDTTTSGPHQNEANQQTNGNGGAVTSSVARARRLVSLSRLNNSKHSPANDIEQNGTCDGLKGQQSAAKEGHYDTDVDNQNASANSNVQNGGDANGAEGRNGDNGESIQFTDASCEHARTVKLSYSQSNITLRNPYWTSKRDLGDVTSVYKQSRHFYSPEDCSDKSKPKGGLINGQNDVRTLFDPASLPVRLHQSVSGQLTTAPQKGCNGSDDGQEARKSATAHRQVSLVLKKVSIQDSGIPDESSKARSVSTPLLPRSATRRHANGGLSAKNDVTLNHHMVPLGELLPAVEQNIKYHMQSTNHKTSPETDLEEEIYILDKETGTPIKDKVLSYEDSLVMMREGMELIKLKERHQSILGPPAFRPHPNKTPLQRAKETSTKRIYGQLNYTGNIMSTN